MDNYTNVIELDNVVKDYGDFKLDNVSFAVPKGSVTRICTLLCTRRKIKRGT